MWKFSQKIKNAHSKLAKIMPQNQPELDTCRFWIIWFIFIGSDTPPCGTSSVTGSWMIKSLLDVVVEVPTADGAKVTDSGISESKKTGEERVEIAFEFFFSSSL